MKTRATLTVITLIGVAMASVQSARAATITVAYINDSGGGSLRQALADANDGDTVNFSLITPATITLTSGELLVNKSVTISGPGADQLSVNGNASSRVFHISPGKTVTISGLTITNGYVFDGNGAGIYNENGTLTINNSTLSGNSGFFLVGAGIYNAGTLTINDSTVSDNSKLIGDGGGICNGGTLTITNTTFSGNLAPADFGGAIANYGSLTITNSTFTGNSASLGGGIFNQSVTLTTINNSTFSDNSAYAGGAIYNYFTSGTTLTITNSTLSGNSAEQGGGIFNMAQNAEHWGHHSKGRRFGSKHLQLFRRHVDVAGLQLEQRQWRRVFDRGRATRSTRIRY